jgi:hypothetical protein
VGIGDPAKWGVQCRDKAITALQVDDWHAAYEWAKSWIMGGGGNWIVEPWLVYAASGVLHGQPRIATHSVDLALGHWISEPADRAILFWVRGCVIRSHLHDPKTALSDLEAAQPSAAAWLGPRVAIALDQCRHEASLSRERKPSVGHAAQDFKALEFNYPMQEPPRVPWLPAGSLPTVWKAVVLHISVS